MFVCAGDPHVVAKGDVFCCDNKKIAPRPDRDESPGTRVRATGSAHAGGRLSFGRLSSLMARTRIVFRAMMPIKTGIFALVPGVPYDNAGAGGVIQGNQRATPSGGASLLGSRMVVVMK